MPLDVLLLSDHYIRFHDLRHAISRLMLADGAQLIGVSSIFGQASVATTA
jgi:site-specific recombinase XerD